MLSMHFLGAEYVAGCDINFHKIAVAKMLGLAVENCDVAVYDFEMPFDFIWCSHTLEHVWDIQGFLQILHHYLADDGVLGIVVPYPDTGDATAHLASRELGLYEKDNGATFTKYLETFGFELIFRRIDSFREPEIWVALRKKHE